MPSQHFARTIWLGMGISATFCLGLALALLLAPLPWVAAWLFAAAVHELFHYVAIRSFCGKGVRLRLSFDGARMQLPEMSRGREALCAIAGPAGSLCLLLIAKWLPRVAICATIQAMYNLLPVYPMDGGRALQSALSLLLPPRLAANICSWVEILCILALFTLAIYGCVWLKLGLFPLLLVLHLCIRLK